MLSHAPPLVALIVMAIAGMIAGALWVGIAGYLRHARGVNETISSLLLTYIGIAIMNFFVEGSLRDLTNPNKPSTMPIGDDYMVGKIPGTDVHWGLAAGIFLAIVLHILLSRTTFGFAVRITGGNPRAAMAQGLPVGKLIVICSMIAGACAGLAGFFEVAAIQGRANASLAAGYGFTGILVAFLARHNPLAIIPVAIMFGGIVASGGLVQRRMDLPDATVLVLQGLIFVVLLVSETLYGRFKIFQVASTARPHMSDNPYLIVLFAIVGGALRVSTPFMFVALGECLTEKSGRVNLGLEGTLVLGAMTRLCDLLSHRLAVARRARGRLPPASVLGGIHGYVCKLPKVNDIAIGIAMMLFGTGIAFFFGKAYIQPSAPRLGSFSLGAWTGNPQIETALQINPLLIVGVVVAIVMAWAFANTRWGLIVRMTGDSAASARARWAYRSISVRFLATAVGGFLAGVGGAFLSLYYPGSWNQGLSSGQGLMAVALVIFARWKPMLCVVAALLFGAAGAIGPALQSVGITQGYYFFNAAPYILTLADHDRLGRLEAGRARRARRIEHHQVSRRARIGAALR